MSMRRVRISNSTYVNLDANAKSCAKCPYRHPWNNYCKFFSKGLERVGQANCGFHHNRCENCLAGELKWDPLAGNLQEQEARFRSWIKRYSEAKQALKEIERGE